MPTVSEKQRKFMQAAKHSKEFAKKAGIDQKVAEEFIEADKKKAEADKKKTGKTPSKAKPSVSKEDHNAKASLGYKYGKEV